MLLWLTWNSCWNKHRGIYFWVDNRTQVLAWCNFSQYSYIFEVRMLFMFSTGHFFKEILQGILLVKIWAVPGNFCLIVLILYKGYHLNSAKSPKVCLARILIRRLLKAFVRILARILKAVLQDVLIRKILAKNLRLLDVCQFRSRLVFGVASGEEPGLWKGCWSRRI